METRGQGLPLFTGICFLIGVLVIVQLWLLAAALETYDLQLALERQTFLAEARRGLRRTDLRSN